MLAVLAFFRKIAYLVYTKKNAILLREEKGVMEEIVATPVWLVYRGKIIVSNEMFVRAGTVLPFEQGSIAVISAAADDKRFPSEALKPLKLSVQGGKLPEDLILTTANLRKHLQVLKETGKITFMFRADGSLSVNPKESLGHAG